jgi:hypothetical protein
MPLYRGTVYKVLTANDGHKWVNNYWVNDTSPELALDRMDDIADIEAAVLPQAVTIYRLTVQPAGGGDSSIRVVDKQGEIDLDPANLIPLFNTVRVIMTDNVGRVESKYLRALIFEANVQGYNISGELVDQVNSLYCTPLLGILTLRGPNNEPITSIKTQQLIQVRQIGWHRRTRPGQKRGWVPA